MNLNKLRDKAYQCAVTHGWHEENLSDEHFLWHHLTEPETSRTSHMITGKNE